MTALASRLLAEAKRSAEMYGGSSDLAALLREAAAALSARVPEGDMALALEWVRTHAMFSSDPAVWAHCAAIEEAIAAYDPERAGAVSGITPQPGDGMDSTRLDWLLARINVDRWGVCLPCGSTPPGATREQLDAAMIAAAPSAQGVAK